MRTFSDIPEFILDEYLSHLLSTNEKSEPISTILSEEVLFTNYNDIDFTDYNDIVWNLQYTLYNKADTTKSYLRTPKSLIVAKGGKKMETFVETETEFKKVKIVPFENDLKVRESDWVGSYYNFDIMDDIYPVASNTINYTLPVSGSKNYAFEYYDCFNTTSSSGAYQQGIETDKGYKIYLRKKSLYHDWGEDIYYDYMNFNEDFLFIGRIFPYSGDQWKCRIFRYLLKDYVINTLPTNNRPERLVEFFYNVFDRTYSKIYYKMNDVKSLYDPSEINIQYIDELAENYDVKIGDFDIDNEDRLRELTKNIPIIMKKKGTYSSIISIWKFISGFDNQDARNINIYEWWHDTLSKGKFEVSEDDWQEVNYLNRYNNIDTIGCATDSYYSRYTSVYPDFYQANLYSIINDAYIHKQVEPISTWDITHWIGSDRLFVQCFDEDYNIIMPLTVAINDESSLQVNFHKETRGYCVICKVTYQQAIEGTYWKINHYINKRSIFGQSFSSINELFYPQVIYSKDFDTGVIQPYTNTEGYAYYLEGDYIYYNLNAENTDSYKWTINHNLNQLTLVQVYDINDNIIFPKRISHNDLSTTTIEFSSPTNGYVILKSIGNVESDITEGRILSPHYKIECDLTCKPIDSDAIFSEGTAENTYSNFEEVRPANRVANYHMVFSPLIDFSGYPWALYQKEYDAYWNSVCAITRLLLEDNAVHYQSEESDYWRIDHTLGTKKILVFTYDLDYNEFYASSINSLDYYTVEIEIETPQSGYAIIVRADVWERFFGVDNEIDHEYGRQVLSQFTSGIYHLEDTLFPEEIVNKDNKVSFEIENQNGYAFLAEGNYIWEQTIAAETWEVEHNQGYGIVVQFFDENWERIFPSNITLTNNNKCTANFDSAIKGYAVIRAVGYMNFQLGISEEFTENGCYVYLGDGTDKNYIKNYSITELQNKTAEIYVSAENCYMYGDTLCIDIELDDKNKEYDIREIGILDSNKERLYFYSQGSQLYKYNKYTMTIHVRIEREII